VQINFKIRGSRWIADTVRNVFSLCEVLVKIACILTKPLGIFKNNKQQEEQGLRV